MILRKDLSTKQLMYTPLKVRNLLNLINWHKNNFWLISRDSRDFVFASFKVRGSQKDEVIAWSKLIIHSLWEQSIDFDTNKVRFTSYCLQVFTMDIESASSVTYSDEKSVSFKWNKSFNSNFNFCRTGMLEKMAEQLATLCSTLGEFPSIRYRAWA